MAKRMWTDSCVCTGHHVRAHAWPCHQHHPLLPSGKEGQGGLLRWQDKDHPADIVFFLPSSQFACPQEAPKEKESDSSEEKGKAKDKEKKKDKEKSKKDKEKEKAKDKEKSKKNKKDKEDKEKSRKRARSSSS